MYQISLQDLRAHIDAANPPLVILPFKAADRQTGQPLSSFEEVEDPFSRGLGYRVRIERSYPGAPEAIGWTIFFRTRETYVYSGAPLTASEHECRQYIRQAYAVRFNHPDEFEPVGEF